MDASDMPYMPKRYYVVGDEISLRVRLSHAVNIQEVAVVFGREGRNDNTITFFREPDETETVDEDVLNGYRHMRSTAILRMLVDVDHRPGYYKPIQVSYRTAEENYGSRGPEELGEAVQALSFYILSGDEAPPVEVEL